MSPQEWEPAETLYDGTAPANTSGTGIIGYRIQNKYA